MADHATDQAAVADVTAQAKAFSCPACSHRPQAHCPPFLSEQGLAAVAAVVQESKTVVTKPHIPARTPEQALQLMQHQQQQQQQQVGSSMPAATPKAVAASSSSSSKLPAGSVIKPQQGAAAAAAHSTASSGTAATATTATTATAATPSGGKAAVPQEVEWKVVASKKGKGKQLAGPEGVLGHSAGGVQQSVAVHTTTAVVHINAFSALELEAALLLEAKLASQAASSSSSGAALVGGDSSAPSVPVMTKTAKKNLARKLKRQAKEDGSTSAAATSPAAAAAAAAASKAANGAAAASSSKSAAPDGDAGDGFTAACSKKLSKQAAGTNASAATSTAQTLQQQLQALQQHKQGDIIQSVMDEWGQEQQQHMQRTQVRTAAQQGAPAADSQQGELLLGLQQPMGQLGLLSRDDLLAVLCLLRPADLAALSSTCKGLHAACQDGALWQALIKAHYPGAQVTASRMSDWKHAYVLEANSILDDLKCFYTRASYDEEVLGLPISFTINPKTQAVDYIEAFPDLIAVSAFNAGVNKTSSQDTFKAVLPLYLTADHFARAQPLYPKLLRLLAPEAVGPGGTSPPVDTWLDVLSKILNTAVVLLCDHGQVASHKALSVYCAVHRLLLAMCQAHNLWPAVRARLDKFLSSPAHRTKEACPNLGLLYPLLSLSRTHTWQQLASPLLTEMWTRNVLWVCKAKPSLEERYRAPKAKADEGDKELLEGSFEGARISTRLLLFHIAFLRLVGAPPGCSLERVMDTADTTYGLPSSALGNRFLRAVRKVMEVGSWQQYLTMLGMPNMSEGVLTNMLKDAWARSCSRGYTRPGMDYSRIQKSGVSKILLKGQSYTAPPGMKQIDLKDCWKWKASSGTKFLDASILLYGPNRQHIETIDYSHRSSHLTASGGAVDHSGDVMDHAAHSGTHTVHIDLHKLGPKVTEMYVVASAFAGAKLIDIVQPFVQVCDPATGMVLCEYQLEDQHAHVRQANSAVIMARIHRAAGSPDAVSSSNSRAFNDWKVQALGVLGGGDASNYGPIYSKIRTADWDKETAAGSDRGAIRVLHAAR